MKEGRVTLTDRYDVGWQDSIGALIDWSTGHWGTLVAID